MTTTNASNALMRVLHDWGVRTIYGLPGGSFDSTMNAIHDFSDRIRYVGVRHEEIGALAAVAEAKMTGHIGVVFGSAGPGHVPAPRRKRPDDGSRHAGIRLETIGRRPRRSGRAPAGGGR